MSIICFGQLPISNKDQLLYMEVKCGDFDIAPKF